MRLAQKPSLKEVARWLRSFEVKKAIEVMLGRPESF